MFKITNGSGFHITLENGFTVSVQWGPATYSDNHDKLFSRGNTDYDEHNRQWGATGSTTAECAVWGPPDNAMIDHPMFDGDVVGARMTPAQVLELLSWAATQPGPQGPTMGVVVREIPLIGKSGPYGRIQISSRDRQFVVRLEFQGKPVEYEYDTPQAVRQCVQTLSGDYGRA